MTPKEAILQLKTDKLCLMAIASHPSLINVDEIEVAISALEKQIPKKVKRYESCKGGKIKCLGACEVCGCAVQPNESYCLRCGQALDWSDTE